MATERRGLGNTIAPPRFLLFLALEAAGSLAGMAWLGARGGAMAGFDLAAFVFLLSVLPLLDDRTETMRSAVARNDANRLGLLVITAIVTLVVLVAVGAELAQKGAPKPATVALVIATLVLAWTFANTIFTLHYAHLFYSADEDGTDQGGLDFPKTDEPDYWDFVYFAFCLGMTFQTSDVDMTDGRFRRTATAHCLLAFVFNLGVLAFTINVLGGG